MVATESQLNHSALQALIARRRAYGLLSSIVLGGTSDAEWAHLMRAPVIAELCGSTPVDHVAAAHYELLSMEVFPHASVFLDPAGLAGGARATACSELYTRWRFVAPEDVAPDHLGVQLAFLAHLSGVESAARRYRDEVSVAAIEATMRGFIDDHVLSYLVPFIAAVRHVMVPVFHEVVDLVAGLVAAHRHELGGDVVAPAMAGWQSPLADQAAGLRDVAAFMLVPARSGVWLSRSDVVGMARDQDIPRGFGSRVQMLTNLLRNAAEYDRATEVLGALDSLLAERASEYMHIGVVHGIESHAAAWVEHVERTRGAIAEMRAAVAA